MGRTDMRIKLLYVIIAIVILFVPTNAFSKPVLSVLDFSGGESASKPELLAASTLLASAIFETDLVEVIDRSRRDEILREIEFSLSDCSDQECAIEVGRLLSAVIVLDVSSPISPKYEKTIRFGIGPALMQVVNDSLYAIGEYGLAITKLP